MNHVEAWKALFEGKTIQGGGYRYRIVNDKLEGHGGGATIFRVDKWAGPSEGVIYTVVEPYTKITYEEAYDTPLNNLRYRTPNDSEYRVCGHYNTYPLGCTFYKVNE